MGMSTNASTFLPLDALAGQLGLPRKWLSDEARAGRIPYLIAGGRKVFDAEQVRQVLLSRATQPAGVADGK
jgi:hypothetical protein